MSEIHVNVVEQAANFKALTERLNDRDETLIQQLTQRDEAMTEAMKAGFEAVRAAVEPLAARVQKLEGEHQPLMVAAAEANKARVQTSLRKKKMIKGGVSLIMAGAGAVAAKLGPTFWDWLTR